MRLSIIIPIYNVAAYLSFCLDSLLSQNIEHETYEIILIDDGSTDNSLAICKRYATDYSNIRVYHYNNAGVGASRNKGITLAFGEYIYFIDPDDYIASNVLCNLLKIVTSSQLDIIGFQSLATKKYNLNKSHSDFSINPDLEIMNGAAYMAKFKCKNEIWWYFIKRSFLLDSGIIFIEGRWMEDAIFTAQLLLKCERMAFVSWDVHRHVSVPDSAMNSREPAHYLRVIYDNANAAEVFNEIIKTQIESGADPNLLKRLKARQHSFVFFLLIRAYKSTMPYTELKKLLVRLNGVSSYPITNFIGIDYNRFVYRILVLIFNNKYLLKNSFRAYRIIK